MHLMLCCWQYQVLPTCLWVLRNISKNIIMQFEEVWGCRFQEEKVLTDNCQIGEGSTNDIVIWQLLHHEKILNLQFNDQIFNQNLGVWAKSRMTRQTKEVYKTVIMRHNWNGDKYWLISVIWYLFWPSTVATGWGVIRSPLWQMWRHI